MSGKETSTWIAVAKVADLAPESARVVRAAGLELALLCTADGIVAMDNACPHSGGPLGEGRVQGQTVTCPLHGWHFDTRTGRCLTEKRPPQRLYPTRIEQDQVWVEVPMPSTNVTSTATAEGAAATRPTDDTSKKSRVEIWKAAKHGLDVWPDILRYAQEGTPMAAIDEADLERMKWYGYFYRKNNDNDHYMCRIRLPGNELSTDQARAVAFVAYESGYSIVDITTRGNVQIQGLTIAKLPGVRAALERVGLTSRQSGHDNVRNVTSHPLSGLDPDELYDTRELARQIQAMIIGNREFSDLPRKFNIAMTGRPQPAVHAWTQDLSYVAAPGPDGSVGFQLLLGGTQGQSPKLAWHIPVFVRPEQVLGVTAAILRTFRELGARHNRNQVRLRYLIEHLGPDQVLLAAEQRLGYELERFAAPAPTQCQEEQSIGWYKQKQEDLWAVGVCVPVGRLTWDQCEGLAVIARQYGNGTLRTTCDQNLFIVNIPTASKPAVGYALARHGLTFEPDPVTRNMVACTGKQFCNIALTETKGYAYQLIEALRRRLVHLHGIRIHMSGCPSSCAMTYTADIGLKSVKIRRRLRVLDAFDVYLGGGLADTVQMGLLYRQGVPFDELPECLEEIIREFYVHRRDPETFSAYWRKKLRGHTAASVQRHLPTWRCSHCGYLHVAHDPPPFCPTCAALRARFEPAPTAEEAAAEPEAQAPEPHARSAPVPLSRSSRRRTQDTTSRPRPSGKRLLIIGGGIAAHTAAQTARQLEATAQITLVTDEPHTFYNRLNLTRFLAGEVQRADLFDYAPTWYEEQQIEVLTGTRVIGLDPVQKVALLHEGRELAYDACILAHGSAPAIPPFYRADLAGVFLLRTLEDVDGIMAAMQPGARVAVIGGGVLGVEAAYGLMTRGAATVQVFERLPRLMSRQLDQAGAALFTAMVRDKGLTPHVGVEVQELLGTPRVEGLRLADGQEFAADLVLVSTGITPHTDWVKRSGIHCRRGVLVDDRMQTSSEGVFAAGDVAEWQGQVVGLWANAIEQARVAATNAMGKVTFFRGYVPLTILKCLGIPLIAIGDILEDGDGVTSQVVHDAEAGTYRRVIFRHGLPIAGLLLGTSQGMGDMRQLVEGGLALERLQQQVLAV